MHTVVLMTLQERHGTSDCCWPVCGLAIMPRSFNQGECGRDCQPAGGLLGALDLGKAALACNLALLPTPHVDIQSATILAFSLTGQAG